MTILETPKKITAQSNQTKPTRPSSLEMNRVDILRDYRIACESRETSLIGRREVLSGKAKFGIFGDGKEVAQLAMAHAFQKGDWRSGYYRDQTFMFAIGGMSIEQFFAQLYAHADLAYDAHSGGRQMNAHFASRLLNGDSSWKDQTQMYNVAADLSPTASQMPRLVGLGYASRLYRELESLQQLGQFSNNGREIAWGTIGNASCAEGLFWESLNAIGVLKSPVILSIWDDNYGISVTNEHQVTKGNLSELLQGFQRQPGDSNGFQLYTVPGWDYLQLMETYQKAMQITREQHVPAIIHVVEMTQPQGHSTSGSHERYKSAERLAWEEAHDPLHKMREWIIEQRIASAGELDNIERNARKQVEHAREKAWKAFMRPVFQERQEAVALIEQLEAASAHASQLAAIRRRLVEKQALAGRDILTAVHQILRLTRHENIPAAQQLAHWKTNKVKQYEANYGSHLVSESAESTLKVNGVTAVYSPSPKQLKGYEILNQAFDHILATNPRVVAFGEDVGRLGDVNQAFSGLQAKHGELRVSDTGIREATIIGQGIGLALRGLRPIAEIQYLDYLLYALQILSDDLATLHWRTKGGQKAPLIIRTRGHRLEGIWHAGSPMAGALNLLRGMHICVPRNMVQAVGFYNTLLQGDDPALIVEVLNGYRLREPVPDNLTDFSLPLGVPEVVRAGEDLTIVTYGACVQVAQETAVLLAEVGIDPEIIDVQTLLPFDIHGRIGQSLQKTGRVIFLDEDVPGGTTAYMMQQVLEKQGGFWHLDAEARTLSAKPHRPSYGSDGAYFSKPNVEELFEMAYDMMHETDPTNYPIFYQ